MTVTQRNPMQVEMLEGRRLLTAAWGQQEKLIGMDKLVAEYPQLTGAGQSVAVIDSGVAYTHPALAGKVTSIWDYAGNDSNAWPDSDPHGTGVAAAIAASPYDYAGGHFQGVAPGVKILAIRQNSSYGVHYGLQWVIANKAKYNITAVNVTDWGNGSAAMWNSIKADVNTLAAMNVLVTIPSGNTGSTVVPTYGGAEASVGSTNAYGAIASNSTRGYGLDFLAPAAGITLPYWYNGPIYTNQAAGTSWAAPQIAGASTIIRQINPNFSNAQVKSILADSAAKVYDSRSGLTFPLYNIYNAVKLAYQRAGQADPTPTPPPVTTPTPTPTDGQTGSTATSLVSGTVLQVEDFDAGANGVAYKELDPKNFGNNNYRTGTGVDIFTISDAGSTRAVGGIRAGEWLRYSVNVKTAGTYTVEFRLASQGDGGKFHLEVDGKNVTGSLSAGSGADWNTYRSVSKAINLTAGAHQLKLVFEAGGTSGAIANFNYLKFTAGSTAPDPATPATSTVNPFATVNLKPGVAAVIQAENYDYGPRGTSFWDTDTTNSGGQYRTGGVDIAATNDAGGGYLVGANRAGEWYNYTVNVATAGNFTFDVRQAMAGTGGAFHIEVDGKNVTGALAFKSTGSFKTWGDVVKSGVALTAGKHTIRLVIDKAGSMGIGADINWIKIY